MRIFFDTEFTGLHKNTTLISMGFIAENGNTFYAELTDYDKSQIDDWLKENVIGNLVLDTNYDIDKDYHPYAHDVIVRGDKEEVSFCLSHWLYQFDNCEMWSDCLSYDWVLFCDLFGHAFNIPEKVYYIPFDICTLFKIKGIDPDISREGFSIENSSLELACYSEKHNALWDAQIIKMCYEKLTGDEK